MSVILRPYQEQLVCDINEEWDKGHKNVLAVKPCRSGKTVTFTSINADNLSSCTIVHRQELVGQISATYARVGVPHNIIAPQSVINYCISEQIKAVGRQFYHPKAPATIAGVDTLIRRFNQGDQWCNGVQRWTLDEAHHGLQVNKWGTAVALFPNARGLGVTATPIRADRKSLHIEQGGLFDTLVQGIGMRELVSLGNVCDYRVLAPEPSINEAELKIGSTGEFTDASSRKAAHKSQIVGDVVRTYQQHIPGKSAIVYTVDVSQAEELAEKFRQAGVSAASLDGKTPDALRQSTVDRFTRGEIRVLTNCDLFAEGLDLPGVDAVIMARPTMSFGMFVQQFCLDPDTEVLTRDGWKGVDDLENITSVTAFDMSDDSVSEQPVTGKIRRKRYLDERMFGMSSKFRDICVSDRHEMISKATSGTTINWVKHQAQDFAKFKSMRKIPVAGFGNFTGCGLHPHELHFIGWWLSDGTHSRTNNTISISQSVNKIEQIEHLRRTLNLCGFKYGEYIQSRENPKHNDLLRFTISYGKPKGTNKHLTGYKHLSEWLNKSLPEIFDTLTREEFQELMIGIYMGDGTKYGTDWTKIRATIACGDNHVLANRLQAMAVVRGFRAMVSYFQPDDHRSKWAIVHLKDTATATVAGSNTQDGIMPDGRAYIRTKFGEIQTDVNEVWCVENPLGTLITRRNGKVTIMGNCRCLTPSEGKPYGIVIDHVGNILRMAARYGMPDTPRRWQLWREEGKRQQREPDAIPHRVCESCALTYEAITMTCPFCGHTRVPEDRGAPEQVDGILAEMSPELLNQLRMAKADVWSDSPAIPNGASDNIIGAKLKQHAQKQMAHRSLQEAMEFWGGVQLADNYTNDQMQARFLHRFGVDVMTAQGLPATKAIQLAEEIRKSLS